MEIVKIGWVDRNKDTIYWAAAMLSLDYQNQNHSYIFISTHIKSY